MASDFINSTPHEALLALGAYVRKVRLNQEMTLEELATRVGVSRSSLIRLEKLGAGSTDTQVKVFAALGLLDSFVELVRPPEKPLTIAELKKMSSGHQRQRGRRKPRGIS